MLPINMEALEGGTWTLLGPTAQGLLVIPSSRCALPQPCGSQKKSSTLLLSSEAGWG